MTTEKRWLLPEGIDELLPENAGQLEALRRNLLDQCATWGYRYVIPPLVEFTDSLLVGLGADLDLVTCKFTDQMSGRMLGVRADITPQAARIDAHSLGKTGATRLCYAGSTLQAVPQTTGVGRSPIQLGAELALQLLHELYVGRAPQFLRRATGTHSAAEPETVEVGLSAVNFRSSFASYQQCLEQLMPVSLSELRRSRLHFLPNESALNEASLAWLTTLVEFIKRDDQLESVFIDGYTDNSHSARYNRVLSKRRAEAVQDFFLQQGVSADLILLRFHGERFPIASNENPQGREQNRRVTIRLQRQSPRFAHR